MIEKDGKKLSFNPIFEKQNQSLLLIGQQL